MFVFPLFLPDPSAELRDEIHRLSRVAFKHWVRTVGIPGIATTTGVKALTKMLGAPSTMRLSQKSWTPRLRPVSSRWIVRPSRAQRKRFHRFQHRALVQALTHKAQGMGARVLEVYARGTSRWAYDGSGAVRRSKTNAQLATFATGKQYNADLNGALNIAARGLALLLGLKAPEPDKQAVTGKSSGAVARTPLVLADIWAHARLSRGPSNLAA